MLQLDQYFFPKISVESNPEYKGGSVDLSGIKPQFSCGRTSEGPESRLVMLMTLAIERNGSDMPYEIQIDGFAEFHDDGGRQDSKAEIALARNAINILYTAARELLLLVTSRGAWGPFQLPTRVFSLEDFGIQPPSDTASPPKKSTARKRKA